MVFAHLTKSKTVFYPSTMKQMRIGLLKCAFQFAAQKGFHFLDFSGNANVIVGTSQIMVLSGPGQTSVMIDVLVTKIKIAVDLMQ